MNLLPPSFSFSGDRNKAITLRPFAIHAYNRVVREAARGGVPFANYFKTLPDGSIVHFKAQKNSVFNNWSGRIQIFSPQLEEELVFSRDFKVYISRVLVNQHYGDVYKWEFDLSEDKGRSGMGGIRYYSTVHKGSIYTINPFTFEDTESNIAISRDVEFGDWLVFPKHIPNDFGSRYVISSNENYLAIWSYRSNATSMLHLVPWLDPSARIDIPIDLPYDNTLFRPADCFSINNANQIMIGGRLHPDTFPGDDKFRFHIYQVDIDENQYEKLWEYTNNHFHHPGWPAGFITNDYAVFAESNNITAATGGEFTIFNVSTGQVLIDKQLLYPTLDGFSGISHIALKDNNLYFVSRGYETPSRVHHYKLLENDGVLSANYQFHIEQESTPVFTGVWTS